MLLGDCSQVMFYHDGETVCSVLTCFGAFTCTNPLPGQYTNAQMLVLDILQQSGGLSAPVSFWFPDNDGSRDWGWGVLRTLSILSLCLGQINMSDT